MTLMCRGCSRVNPPDAVYCYYDGLSLDNGAGATGPVAAGRQPFPFAFVFPSGRTCHNFDQMVLASHELWDEARELLHEGAFAGFLNGIGRADLGKAAKQGMNSPAPDRALDDLLGLLPSEVRQPPVLYLATHEFNLGEIIHGEARQFVVEVENHGMALLCGTIASVGAPWLVLGDPPGKPQKLFECRHSLAIPVQVVTERVRAGNRPLEARLVVETNGGDAEIVVRAERPVRAFPEGVLAGALTPRLLAEAARSGPRQAIPLFESGAVARWYEANGWDYPIRGEPATGPAALQQYFEALGLASPPLVEVSELLVRLQGDAGDRLEHNLVVTAIENRPVYASAVSTAPWLQVGKVALDGRVAKLPLLIPSVPAPGATPHTARVRITANGNQSFAVTVLLTVRGDRGAAAAPAGPPAAPAWSPRPERAAEALRQTEVIVDSSHPRPGPADQRRTEVEPDSHEGGSDTATWVAPPVAPPRPAAPAPPPAPGLPVPAAPPPPGPFWPHLIPLAVVLALLAGTVLYDVRLDPRPEPEPPEQQAPEVLLNKEPFIKLEFHDALRPDDKLKKKPDDKPRFEAPTMRFGVVMARENDPKDPKRRKRLTYSEYGWTNNTCLRVDAKEVLFGSKDGKWGGMKRELGKDPETGLTIDGAESVWRYGDLEVRQVVKVVPGRQSARLDTCLVRYVLENKGTKPLKVGLRFLLDTFIGANDGVPFTIPGKDGLCDEQMGFDKPSAVPDYIEALERDDLREPGTVARVRFRGLSERVEAPDRVTLGGWPETDFRAKYPAANGKDTLWDVPVLDIRALRNLRRDREGREEDVPKSWRQTDPDSAVTMYWPERELAAGASREVGFAYGPGTVFGDEKGKLGLSLDGRFVPGGEFTLTAQVSNPGRGEKLTLELPAGFELLPGSPTEQEVPPVAAGAGRSISVVTWRVRAGPVGTHNLLIRSSTGDSVKQSVRVHPAAKAGTPGVFD